MIILCVELFANIFFYNFKIFLLKKIIKNINK